MGARIGGVLFVKINGVQFRAKSTSWTYNITKLKKEGVVGVDGTHGYKELPVLNFIEGVITDDPNLDIQALQSISDSTVTLELANQKVIVLRNAWFAGDVDQTTEEGEVPFRLEGLSGEEV